MLLCVPGGGGGSGVLKPWVALLPLPVLLPVQITTCGKCVPLSCHSAGGAAASAMTTCSSKRWMFHSIMPSWRIWARALPTYKDVVGCLEALCPEPERANRCATATLRDSDTGCWQSLWDVVDRWDPSKSTCILLWLPCFRTFSRRDKLLLLKKISFMKCAGVSHAWLHFLPMWTSKGELVESNLSNPPTFSDQARWQVSTRSYCDRLHRCLVKRFKWMSVRSFWGRRWSNWRSDRNFSRWEPFVCRCLGLQVTPFRTEDWNGMMLRCTAALTRHRYRSAWNSLPQPDVKRVGWLVEQCVCWSIGDTLNMSFKHAMPPLHDAQVAASSTSQATKALRISQHGPQKQQVYLHFVNKVDYVTWQEDIVNAVFRWRIETMAWSHFLVAWWHLDHRTGTHGFWKGRREICYAWIYFEGVLPTCFWKEPIASDCCVLAWANKVSFFLAVR